jgi:glycerophosphoryl diester phosphodiesterase
LNLIRPFLSLDRLLAIAHRGGSALRPENTLAAFDHAVSLGVDAIECDVHVARDGEVVVIHDPTLDRTTDATGPVAASTAAELADVDAGFHFAPQAGFPFRGRGCRVPTLRELLQRYRHLPIVVEIKGDRPEAADRVIGVIREHDALNRVVVGGFNHGVISEVRRQQPDLVTSASSLEARSALTRSRFLLSPRRPAFQLFQMPFRLHGRQMFRRSFVRAARRGGLPVQAWIIDEPADMRRLIDWGVTGIISDRPDVAVDIVKAEGKSQKA